MSHIYAVLSDIHANYPALRAVQMDAEDISRAEEAELHWIVLGDIVDYGPHPQPCFEWVDEHCQEKYVIQGNHDAFVSQEPGSLPNQTLVAKRWWPISLWTNQALFENHRQNLRNLPQTLQVNLFPHATGVDFTLVHGSLSYYLDGRIDSPELARSNLEALPTSYGLFGHTHLPGYFVDENIPNKLPQMVLARHENLDDESDTLLVSFNGNFRWTALPRHRRILLNPGSVGYPKQHPKLASRREACDARASYLLLRYHQNRLQVSFRRVRYPIGQTISDLKKITFSQQGMATTLQSYQRYQEYYKDIQKEARPTTAALPVETDTQVLELLKTYIHEQIAYLQKGC